MKRLILFLIMLSPLAVWGQPDLASLQKEWVEKIRAGEPTVDFYLEEKSLIYADVQMQDPATFRYLLANRIITGIQTYKHQRQFKQDANRYISTGYLIADEGTVSLISGWRKINGRWKKEIDILLTLKTDQPGTEETLAATLDAERKAWVNRANNHNPAAHIAYSYTPEAVYFSNGRRSDGTEEIAHRYNYMENPNYTVDLEKEYLHQLTGQKVLEVGRYYTGDKKDNPGGLYVLLWVKQEDESWKIALDFNF